MFNIFNFIYHYKPLINPFVRFSTVGNTLGINELKRDIPIIVSMTTTEDDFDETEISLCSIFNQSVSPDRVILWISKEYELSELPYSITKYIKNGLEIKFVEDKASYTNIIYPLKEFPNSIIVTAENNIFYRKDWLKKLYHSFITNPENIHINMADCISFNIISILPKNEWKKFVNKEQAAFKYFPISSGGVLYPPNCFAKEVFREDIYKKLANTSWDIWSWFMALVSNKKFRIIKNHNKNVICINIIKELKRELKNLKDINNQDIQIQTLMEFYKQNIKLKLNSENPISE